MHVYFVIRLGKQFSAYLLRKKRSKPLESLDFIDAWKIFPFTFDSHARINEYCPYHQIKLLFIIEVNFKAIRFLLQMLLFQLNAGFFISECLTGIQSWFDIFKDSRLFNCSSFNPYTSLVFLSFQFFRKKNREIAIWNIQEMIANNNKSNKCSYLYLH